jgi:hypothetical protein
MSTKGNVMLRRGLLGLILGLWTLALVPTVAAQTLQIEYGNFTIQALDQNAPATFYNFTGNEGDYVTVEAVALSASLNPRVTLLTASSETLAVNNNDPFQPGSSDARLTYRLPQTATYTVLVEAEDGSTGQYMLRLERRTVPTAQALGVDLATTANMSGEIPTQAYTFDSSAGTTVTVSTSIDNFVFVAEVLDPNGRTIAIHSGNGVDQAVTSVEAQTGVYTLLVSTAASTVSGTADVQFSSGAAPVQQAAAPAPENPAAEAPETAPTPAEAGAPAPTAVPDTTTPAETAPADGGEGETVGADAPENRCSVTPTAGGVVIRQGPSTDFPSIASIPAGEFRFADGTDGAWIRLVGGGWVSSGVVDLNGPCGALPLVSEPTSPNAAAEQAAPVATDAPALAPIGQRN